MILLQTGDWQLDALPNYDKVNPETNRSTRFDETVETIERVIDDAHAAGATGMVNLGDLTEHKDPKSLESEAAGHLFTRFMKDGRRVWAVAGNHDGAMFEVSSSSFAPLAAMRTDSFKLFHRVAYDVELQMLAIPYIHRATPAEIRAMIATVYEDLPIFKQSFAAIHYGLLGCTVGPKNLVIPGDYLGPDELLVQPLDHIFAGHIHKFQQLRVGTAQGHHPGSPVVCDMGEREDMKTYMLFDTVTRQVTVKEIPQRRRWLSIPYSSDIAMAPATWDANDLVRFTGTYEKPDYPKATLEAAFKAGMPRPFAMEVEVKVAKTERALRSLSVNTSGGLREALQTYVREKYPRFSETPGVMGPATEAALAALQEQGGLTFCAEVVPTNIKISNFMTFVEYDHEFINATPTLIMGENGVGKTNFFEAELWVITGETSKGLELSGVVRQGADEAKVIGEFLGSTPDQEDQGYRITRTVKLSKAGKASQKIILERWDTVKGKWDNSMSDGSQAEVQGRIDCLVGGSYISLRTTNFKFQNDMSPIIRCHPTKRKEVIGEVTGLGPLKRAFKILDTRRLESARALQDGTQRLAGMIAAGEGNEDRIAQLKQDAETVKAELTTAQAEIPAAEIAEAGARQAQTAAKAKAADIESQIQAQPNTEAKVQAAAQALSTYEQTYQSGRAEKVRQHGDLKAQITAAETEIAVTKRPTPEEMQALEFRTKEALDIRDATRMEKETARTTFAKVSAEKVALESNSQTITAAIKAAENDLTVIGVLPSEEEAQAAKVTAEAVAASAVEACTAALQVVMEKREAKRVLEERAAALVLEKKQFDGKDIGACARCGQAIDSSHIEKEKARIDVEAEENRAACVIASVESTKADSDLLAANGHKTYAQAQAKAAGDAVHSLQLKVQLQQSANKKLEGLREAFITVSVDALEKAKEYLDLSGKLDILTTKLTAAETKVTGIVAEIDAARAAVQKVESTMGRLEALRGQLTALIEAGVREKAEFDAEVVRLKLAAEDARKAHESQSVLTLILREQLTAARMEVDTANSSLTSAALALQAIRGKISAAELRIKDIETNITRIESQQGALVTARFELGVMTERAEIDAMAASLLDARDGLPVYLIDQALPFLEDRINHYMGLLGMDSLKVELTTLSEDKETLAVLIDNGRPGPRLDIAAYSGGQLDRVEYGMKCAMADLARTTRGVTFGFQAFDEPTGGLNASGKEALINLLYERSDTYPVTIVTTHDEVLKRAFSHQITFGQGPAEETIVLGGSDVTAKEWKKAA